MNIDKVPSMKCLSSWISMIFLWRDLHLDIEPFLWLVLINYLEWTHSVHTQSAVRLLLFHPGSYSTHSFFTITIFERNSLTSFITEEHKIRFSLPSIMSNTHISSSPCGHWWSNCGNRVMEAVTKQIPVCCLMTTTLPINSISTLYKDILYSMLLCF